MEDFEWQKQELREQYFEGRNQKVKPYKAHIKKPLIHRRLMRCNRND